MAVTMQIILETSVLNLPSELLEKIGMPKVMIREVNEGLLFSPVSEQMGKLRGILKGTGFSTERFLAQKHLDKELEK
jgi:hypothetical protein